MNDNLCITTLRCLALDMIDKASNGINVVVDNAVATITSFISGMFNKKKIEEDYYE